MPSNFLLVIKSIVRTPSVLPPLTFELEDASYLEYLTVGDGIWVGYGADSAKRCQLVQRLEGLQFVKDGEVSYWLADPVASYATSGDSVRGWPKCDLPEEAQVCVENQFFSLLKIDIHDHENFQSICSSLPTSRFGAKGFPSIEQALPHLSSSYNQRTELVREINTFVRKNFFVDELVFDAFRNGSGSMDPHGEVSESLAEEALRLGWVVIGATGLPHVSAELYEIPQGGVQPRVWTQAFSPHDREQARKKLERAEKTHQAILEEACSILRSISIVPYQSRSVDLFFSSSFRKYIVEVKSARPENFNAQFESGLIQILRYHYEFSKKGDTQPILIIEDIGIDNFPRSQFLEFSEHLGVFLIFWGRDPAVSSNRSSLLGVFDYLTSDLSRRDEPLDVQGIN